METCNSEQNLKTLGWDTLQERRLRTKLIYFQRARLGLIEIPTGHLDSKERLSRHDGGGPAYFVHFSDIDAHLFSFFQDCVNLWNNLPAEVRTCEDIKSYASSLEKIIISKIKEDLKK